MTSTLTLAERLGSLTDAELHDLIDSRALGRSRAEDFFDLADALLEPYSVQRALSPLDRPTLATLAAVIDAGGTADADQVAKHLAAWGDADASASDADARLDALVAAFLAERTSPQVALYPGIASRFEAWLEGDGLSGARLAASGKPAALASVPDVERRFVDRLAAERAFVAAGAVAEFVYELEREPARELQKGGLALPDTRRLATALGIEPLQVATVHWFARGTGLVAREGSVWLPTTDAEAWASLSTPGRWARLAATWLESVPEDIRPLMVERAHAAWGDALRGYARWRYPAADATLDRRVDEVEDHAEFLGITARTAPSTAGVTLLTRGPDAAADVVRAAFPSEVDRVYVQNDLSIVAPGPLVPSLDARLRTLADVEGTGLAASFRVSPSSLHRAIAAGETARSLREFIGAISLTGLPQPVAYLIDEAAARYGRVRVRSAASGSVVHSTDDQLLRTIGVDQTLSALALRNETDGTLSSRFPIDVVYWALVDAHYAVVAEDAEGRQLRVRRRLGHPEPHDDTDDAADLVARLRTAATTDGDGAAAWLHRQLESAVRSRTVVTVTVALPDGREHDYTLEPTGLGGGRLRGRDRASDIERTLPVSSIRAVRTQ
ncbi:helicase-associated domain-containing protein [Humibacter albus]|uniref:helicase-associated domain-containing protein n=1 Tax=Humibacter albus TaxID=427754 RepID=UPI0003B65305|nr:helicase-associated domain-containing protein [Humibacter albus]